MLCDFLLHLRTSYWLLVPIPTSNTDALLSLCSFNSVRQGTHILFREFSFVQATPHNRVSFLRTFWRCFRTVGKNGGEYKQFSSHPFSHTISSVIPWAELITRILKYSIFNSSVYYLNFVCTLSELLVSVMFLSTCSLLMSYASC